MWVCVLACVCICVCLCAYVYVDTDTKCVLLPISSPHHLQWSSRQRTHRLTAPHHSLSIFQSPLASPTPANQVECVLLCMCVWVHGGDCPPADGRMDKSFTDLERSSHSVRVFVCARSRDRCALQCDAGMGKRATSSSKFYLFIVQTIGVNTGNTR